MTRTWRGLTEQLIWTAVIILPVYAADVSLDYHAAYSSPPPVKDDLGSAAQYIREHVWVRVLYSVENSHLSSLIDLCMNTTV